MSYDKTLFTDLIFVVRKVSKYFEDQLPRWYSDLGNILQTRRHLVATMSILDQFTFTRSLEVLNSPSLETLFSCSLCSQSLSPTLSSGQCHHALCQDCLKSSPGGVCPVEGCSIPAHPKDYKENRTLGQLAMCLGNIRALLENKVRINDH